MRWRIFDGALNANILIDFLRRLIKGATKKVFVIPDNLRVHRIRCTGSVGPAVHSPAHLA